MDNQKSPEVYMGSSLPPYSSVPPQYPGGSHYPNSGPGMSSMPGAMPEVGFSQGSAGNVGFMPPPMGFHVPYVPQSTNETGHGKEESLTNLVEDPEMDRMNFSEKTIRMAFIRKVYSILMVQLLITTAIIALFCFHEGVKYWVQTNTSFMWML